MSVTNKKYNFKKIDQKWKLVVQKHGSNLLRQTEIICSYSDKNNLLSQNLS